MSEHDAANLTGAVLSAACLAWVHRMTRQVEGIAEPFGSVEEIEYFTDQVRVYAMATLVRDVPAMRALMLSMGMGEFADRLGTDLPNPSMGQGDLVRYITEGGLLRPHVRRVLVDAAIIEG